MLARVVSNDAMVTHMLTTLAHAGTVFCGILLLSKVALRA